MSCPYGACETVWTPTTWFTVGVQSAKKRYRGDLFFVCIVYVIFFVLKVFYHLQNVTVWFGPIKG